MSFLFRALFKQKLLVTSNSESVVCQMMMPGGQMRRHVQEVRAHATKGIGGGGKVQEASRVFVL